MIIQKTCLSIERRPVVVRKTGMTGFPALVTAAMGIWFAAAFPAHCLQAPLTIPHYRMEIDHSKDAMQQKIRSLQSAITAHPDSGICYMQFAELYRGQGKLFSAIPVLKGGVVYLPFSAGLRKALAEAYTADKQFSKALEQYQWCLQLCDSTDRKALRDSITLIASKVNDARRLERSDRSAAFSKRMPRVPSAKVAETPRDKKAAAVLPDKKVAAAPVPPAKSDTVRNKADGINTAALQTAEFRIDSMLSLVALDTLCSAGQQMLLGIHEFLVERYDNALREFKRGSALYPAAPFGAQCLYNAGICYCKLHLFPEAENQFGEILSRFPRDSLAGRALFLKAFTYAQRKDREAAEKLCREFIVSSPHHPWVARAWTMLGNLSLESDRPGDAVDAFQQALSAPGGCPDRASTWMKMGDACRGLGNPDRALCCYDSAVVIGETGDLDCLAQALYRIGDERYKRKDFSGALDCYTKAVYRFPGSVETPWGLFQTGNVHRNLRNYNEAINNYKELVRRFPGSYWAGQAKWQLEDATWESNYLAKK